MSLITLRLLFLSLLLLLPLILLLLIFLPSISPYVCTIGTDTTATLLEWMTLYLAAYPDMQSSLRHEIESVCGRGSMSRPPNLQDRPSCPLVMSAIEELTRFSPMTQINLPRKVQWHTQLGGYEFPEGTQVSLSTYL